MADQTAVADRLHSAAIHLLRRVRRVDAASGLPAAELSALSVVVFAGPIALSDLAAAEQVRPPSMTRTVRALEKGGLIMREIDDADRRVTRVRATAKGARLLTEGRGARVKLLAELLQTLDAGDLSLLDQASKILEQLLARPKETRSD